MRLIYIFTKKDAPCTWQWTIVLQNLGADVSNIDLLFVE